jgi:regulator of protease activity HflC (stomatin/prohibitin superfamily)
MPRQISEALQREFIENEGAEWGIVPSVKESRRHRVVRVYASEVFPVLRSPAPGLAVSVERVRRACRVDVPGSFQNLVAFRVTRAERGVRARMATAEELEAREDAHAEAEFDYMIAHEARPMMKNRVMVLT